MIKKIPKGFIDIHSHILPGLDDGPEDMDQCIAVARQYLSLGINCVIATPHWIRSTGWSHSPAEILTMIDKVEKRLADAQIELTLLPGMEINFSTCLHEDFTDSRLLPLGTGKYFLIEFPLASTRNQADETHLLKKAMEQKIPFIIAHPERCEIFQTDRERLPQLVDNGMLCQLNMDSLLGRFGDTVQETALDFVRRGLVHFLATDSHGVPRRTVPDMDMWKRIEKLFGREAITIACADNPRRMLAGREVTPVKVSPERISDYFTEQFPAKKSNKYNFLMNSTHLAKLANKLKKIIT